MSASLPTRFRALVVDDEQEIRELAVEALSQEGFDCDQAADGQQAMKLIRSHNYTVVVTDLRMPGQNGFQFCRDLLQIPQRPLIVVWTGVLEPKIAIDLTNRGVDDVCFKPVDLSKFALKIKTLVKGRSLEDPAGEENLTGDSDLATEELHETGNQQHVANESLSELELPEVEEPPVASDGIQTRHIVGILLNDCARANELAENLSSSKLAAFAIENSEKLHEFVNGQRVDLLIVEHKLRGFLDGLEILQRLRNELIRTGTILLAEKNTRVKEQADLLGVYAMIDSHCSVDELKDTVRSALSSISDGSMLISIQARKIVQEAERIPPMPQLLVKLLSYLNIQLEEVPLQELANDISVDPKATAGLLRMANSASAGVSKEVTKVFDVIKLFGAKRTIALVFAEAVMKVQKEMSHQSNEEFRTWYSQRSVLIASTASAFAERLERISPDMAFVLGLLQEIGMLILSNRYGVSYWNMIKRFREVGQTKISRMEKEDFNLTHAEISAALLQKWELPNSLIAPILSHHTHEENVARSKPDDSFLRVMRIGEALANLYDTPHHYRRKILNQLLSEYGSEQTQEYKACITESVAKTSESCELFSIPVPRESALNLMLRNALAENENNPKAIA